MFDDEDCYSDSDNNDIDEKPTSMNNNIKDRHRRQSKSKKRKQVLESSSLSDDQDDKTRPSTRKKTNSSGTRKTTAKQMKQHNTKSKSDILKKLEDKLPTKPKKTPPPPKSLVNLLRKDKKVLQYFTALQQNLDYDVEKYKVLYQHTKSQLSSAEKKLTASPNLLPKTVNVENGMKAKNDKSKAKRRGIIKSEDEYYNDNNIDDAQSQDEHSDQSSLSDGGSVFPHLPPSPKQIDVNNTKISMRKDNGDQKSIEDKNNKRVHSFYDYDDDDNTSTCDNDEGGRSSHDRKSAQENRGRMSPSQRNNSLSSSILSPNYHSNSHEEQNSIEMNRAKEIYSHFSTLGINFVYIEEQEPQLSDNTNNSDSDGNKNSNNNNEEEQQKQPNFIIHNKSQEEILSEIIRSIRLILKIYINNHSVNNSIQQTKSSTVVENPKNVESILQQSFKSITQAFTKLDTCDFSLLRSLISYKKNYFEGANDDNTDTTNDIVLEKDRERLLMMSSIKSLSNCKNLVGDFISSLHDDVQNIWSFYDCNKRVYDNRLFCFPLEEEEGEESNVSSNTTKRYGDSSTKTTSITAAGAKKEKTFHNKSYTRLLVKLERVFQCSLISHMYRKVYCDPNKLFFLILDYIVSSVNIHLSNGKYAEWHHSFVTSSFLPPSMSFLVIEALLGNMKNDAPLFVYDEAYGDHVIGKWFYDHALKYSRRSSSSKLSPKEGNDVTTNLLFRSLILVFKYTANIHRQRLMASSSSSNYRENHSNIGDNDEDKNDQSNDISGHRADNDDDDNEEEKQDHLILDLSNIELAAYTRLSDLFLICNHDNDEKVSTCTNVKENSNDTSEKSFIKDESWEVLHKKKACGILKQAFDILGLDKTINLDDTDTEDKTETRNQNVLFTNAHNIIFYSIHMILLSTGDEDLLKKICQASISGYIHLVSSSHSNNKTEKEDKEYSSKSHPNMKKENILLVLILTCVKVHMAFRTNNWRTINLLFMMDQNQNERNFDMKVKSKARSLRNRLIHLSYIENPKAEKRKTQQEKEEIDGNGLVSQEENKNKESTNDFNFLSLINQLLAFLHSPIFPSSLSSTTSSEKHPPSTDNKWELAQILSQCAVLLADATIAHEVSRWIFNQRKRIGDSIQQPPVPVPTSRKSMKNFSNIMDMSQWYPSIRVINLRQRADRWRDLVIQAQHHQLLAVKGCVSMRVKDEDSTYNSVRPLSEKYHYFGRFAYDGKNLFEDLFSDGEGISNDSMNNGYRIMEEEDPLEKTKLVQIQWDPNVLSKFDKNTRRRMETISESESDSISRSQKVLMKNMTQSERACALSHISCWIGIERSLSSFDFERNHKHPEASPLMKETSLFHISGYARGKPLSLLSLNKNSESSSQHGTPVCVVLEDDAILCDSFAFRLQNEILAELPSDFHFCSLGYSRPRTAPMLKYSKHLGIPTCLWYLTGYILSLEGARYLLGLERGTNNEEDELDDKKKTTKRDPQPNVVGPIDSWLGLKMCSDNWENYFGYSLGIGREHFQRKLPKEQDLKNILKFKCFAALTPLCEQIVGGPGAKDDANSQQHWRYFRDSDIEYSGY